jgi:hypothetical protein
LGDRVFPRTPTPVAGAEKDDRRGRLAGRRKLEGDEFSPLQVERVGFSGRNEAPLKHPKAMAEKCHPSEEDQIERDESGVLNTSFQILAGW